MDKKNLKKYLEERIKKYELASIYYKNNPRNKEGHCCGGAYPWMVRMHELQRLLKHI